jgi:hypothetical protein
MRTSENGNRFLVCIPFGTSHPEETPVNVINRHLTIKAMNVKPFYESVLKTKTRKKKYG